MSKCAPQKHSNKIVIREMAENVESWLYGGEKPILPEEPSQLDKAKNNVCSPKKDLPESEPTEFDDPAKEMEEDEEALRANSECITPQMQGQSEGDEDSDDDVNVVIGQINLMLNNTHNVRQRTNLLACSSATDKSKQSAVTGQFSLTDFQGSDEAINGIPVHEFSIDSLEEKPWRKPGSDITDYFNYGFNEMTWRAYCERQKHMRITESGAGMINLTQNPYNNVGLVGINVEDTTMQMPPGTSMQPPRLVMGMGTAMGTMQRPPRPITGCKEQVIKVLTAESRQYSRMNMNFPPPPPGVTDESFFNEPESFDYGYVEAPKWMPTSIKELTPSNELETQPQSTYKYSKTPPTQTNSQIPHQINMVAPQDEDQNPIGARPPRHSKVFLARSNSKPYRTLSSSSILTVSKDGGHDNKRRRCYVKCDEPKRDNSSFQLRKNFLDLLSERQDININTRWHDIKKKLKTDPRYRALDSAYREEYFRDYLHIIIREGKRKRDHKKRHRKDSSLSPSSSMRKET